MTSNYSYLCSLLYQSTRKTLFYRPLNKSEIRKAGILSLIIQPPTFGALVKCLSYQPYRCKTVGKSNLAKISPLR